MNFPPIKAWLQSLVSWMELMMPLVLGAQDVTVYGGVWLKLKMLSLVKVWVEVPLNPLIEVKCLPRT